MKSLLLSQEDINLFDIAVNHNRVVMEEVGVSQGDDYINASWVSGYSGYHEFIVTQHPLVETRETFWRMVIEKDVTTVVALGPLSSAVGMDEGNEDEEGEASYWPNEGVAEYGEVTVELLSMKEERGLTVRELQVEVCMYTSCGSKQNDVFLVSAESQCNHSALPSVGVAREWSPTHP